MSIESFIKPWQGAAVRHIPKSATRDIYDFSYASVCPDNRWNLKGEPTLYLAKEKNVALAEYARHFKVDRTPQLAKQTQERAVYRFDVRLERVLDLCQPKVLQELSIDNSPDCFKDRDVARSCANFIRYQTSATGIFVPSMGFLDDLEQWCLVLFLEKLPADVREFLPSVSPDGTFSIE
jgi:RES domain-containing protein